MKIYIASSWKNEHAVRMLTEKLRERGHEVVSFVENCGREEHNVQSKRMDFDEWVSSEEGAEKFKYDTDGVTKSDLVIYVGPSGTDAWAEVGAAWATPVPVVGLWAKGEPSGLMRRMVSWYTNHKDLLAAIEDC